MKTYFVRIASTIVLACCSVFAQAEAPAAVTTPAQEAKSMTPRQQAWLRAPPQERARLAESLGEEGGRAMAKSKGYEPIFDGLDKAIPQGPDQVYRASDGRVIVYEAKGGSGQLDHAYGHPQGSAEWAVESAKRVLRSTRATAQQKTAAQEILKAASQGNLEVHVIRTSHVLGEPTAAVLEQSAKTSEKAMGLAKEALGSLERGATKGGGNAVRTGTEVVEDLGKSTDGATKAVSNSGRVLRSAAKVAVVVGVGIDVGLRANDAANVERQFAEGKITQHDRVVKHAGNAGGFVGGWTGAYGGAEFGAMDMLESIKTELDGNELLLEDFPEVVYPIQCLDGIANRCSGQLYKGQRTHIGWTAREVVMPTIPQSRASGAIVKVAGITGRIRGMKYKRADGQSVRPALVVLDDPQTDEALDVDTPILTPSGFVPMGHLSVGDTVFDEHGNPCQVLATSPVMYDRECYRITFDDGASVIADGGHRWLTSTALQRTNARRRVLCSPSGIALLSGRRTKQLSSLVTTTGIRRTLTAEGGRHNHSIPLAGPLQTSVAALPVPPYTLGVWLGDGDQSSGRLTTADEEIVDHIQDEGFDVGKFYWSLRAPAGRPGRAWSCTVLGLRGLLRQAGLLGNKHVPPSYWVASPRQRLALLQGLMDTDGSVSKGVAGRKGTRCTFSNTNRRLIDAVLHLCRSLGIKAKCHPIRQTRPGAAPGWIVTFITKIAVFRLPRKRIKLPLITKSNTCRRYVVSVEPVPTRPVRCITVSSPSGLYLCGKELVPTHNSARSISQCATRESILAGAVLGLAGPGKKISGIMPCTVIRPDDMADRILDRDKHPQWQGERTKMVYSFPTNETLWARYAEIRAESLRAERGLADATEFYGRHRDEMDAGAAIAWPERYNHDELSAVQHAMNLRLQDERAFWAEYQNEPLPEETAEEDELTADQVAGKINRLRKGDVPTGCNHLTMFVDVQAALLFYVVAAWEDDFTGYVIDYGAYPDQKRGFFTLRDARPTLSQVSKGAGLEGSIYAGLEELAHRCLGREWHRDDGASMRIERCLVDANWGSSTDVVYQFCRQSAHSALLLPSHGRFVGASSIPFSEYKRKLGDRVGLNWRIPNVQGRRAVRHVVFDTNYWKSFVHARLAVAMGDRGCLSLFGDSAATHRLFAEHLTAEYRVKTEGRGRTVDEWKLRAAAVDNHWLDCLVGCAVAASIQGAILTGTDTKAVPRRPRIRLSELQQNRR